MIETWSVRRLSWGLIAYGIAGIIVSGIGLGATVWVNGRITSIRNEAEATAAQLTTTMEIAATVLRGASTTAQSFSGTSDQTAQAVSSASVTAGEVRSDLSALESQLRSVSFLGATPLSSSADAVGRIATSLDGLDAQLALVADSLTGNAATLIVLADSTDALAARLGPSVGQSSFGDVQQVIAVTLLMFAAWSFVPAVGAFALGIWLRREPARSQSA